jgi:hypothetical protein
MAKTKIRARVPWTKDVRALKTHSKSRTPVAEVAKALKRTEAAKGKDDRRRSRLPALRAG